MTINWKRVVVAAIFAEVLLFAIYFPGRRQYADPSSDFRHIFSLCMLISMFLGGLWVARKIESRFVLHGLLMGIAANVVYVVFRPLFVLSTPPRTSLDWTIYFIVTTFLKMLPAAAGSYVGGRRRKKQLAAQTE
jgi:presenilin-like A22 family membrane protease